MKILTKNPAPFSPGNRRGSNFIALRRENFSRLRCAGIKRENPVPRSQGPDPLYEGIVKIHEILPEIIQRYILPERFPPAAHRLFIPAQRAGVLERPFSIFFPHPRYFACAYARQNENNGRPYRLSAMISLDRLLGVALEPTAKNGEKPAMQNAQPLFEDGPGFSLGSITGTQIKPTTFCRIFSLLRDGLGRSNLDIFCEPLPGKEGERRPAGFRMKILDYRDRQKPTEKSAYEIFREQRDGGKAIEPEEIGPIHHSASEMHTLVSQLSQISITPGYTLGEIERYTPAFLERLQSEVTALPHRSSSETLLIKSNMTLQKATQILRDRKKILDAPRLAYLPTAHSQGLDLGAIGLSRPAQYHEVDPIVSNDLINIALRAREYFIEALNQIIPGLRVPKMMAGDVNTLPFDLVQLGPGRLEEGRDPTREYVYFSMERLSVRKDQGGQAEFEFTPPIEGLSSEEVIVGIQKNKAGYLEQPLPFDYGTLYKIAQVIRRANGFGDAEIVFTKPQIKDGEIILEAHFVYSGARNGWHHQGRGIRPLSIHQQRAIFDATRALQVDNRPILPSPYEWFIQKNSHGIIQGIGISGPIPLDSR